MARLCLGRDGNQPGHHGLTMTTFATLLAEIAAGGTPWKKSVRVVSTTNITMQGLQTVDGVALAEGDRVLVAGQTLAITNGIYAASSNKWTRAADMDRDSYAPLGLTVRVMEGTGAGLWYLSSPTTGTVRVGSTELTFGPADGAAPASLSLPIALSQNQSLDAGSGSGVLGLRLATSGHVNGTTTTVYIAANAWPDGLDIASNAHVVDVSTGTAFDSASYDPTRAAMVTLHRMAGRTFGTFEQLAREDNVAPALILAVVPKSDTDTLELWCDKAVYVDTSKLSLSFSVGTARTITGIKSGQNTNRVILQLSGTISTSDVFDAVFASGAMVDLNGNAFAAQTVAVFWLTLPSSLPGFTSYRSGDVELLSNGQWPAPSGYTDSTSFIQGAASSKPSTQANAYEGASALRFESMVVTFTASTDTISTQNSAAHGISAVDTVVMFQVEPDSGGAMPAGLSENTRYYAKTLTTSTLQVAASAGGATVNFTTDGTATIRMLWRNMPTATQISGFCSNNKDTVWLAAVPRMIALNTATGYARTMLLGAQTYWGITVNKGAGADTATVGAHEYTSGDDKVDVSCQEGTPLLARRRHSGGNMYIRRDRGTESSVASGNVGSTTAALSVCSGNLDAQFCDADIFAIVTTDTGSHSASDVEGIESFFTLQSWGTFLRHHLAVLPPVRRVIAGDTLELYWDQMHLTPDVTQYTYEVSGAGGSVTSSKWSWTTSSGDVGSRTVTITVKLGGRAVLTKTMRVDVVPSTSTATLRVLPLGDSWTNGFTMPDRVRARLVTAGASVTMQGSRGGQPVTFDAGTDKVSLTSHGFAADTPVRFVAALPSGVLPTAVGGDLAEGTTYYVVTDTANTFKLARTVGGGAIDLTSAGTGVSYCIGPNQSNEGRGGETIDDFVYGHREASVGASPFKDAATLGTGRFSWSYYKSTYLSGQAPTDIIVQLGVNSLVSGGYLPDGTAYSVDHDDPDSVETAIGGHCATLERFIAWVHVDDPTVRVHVVMPSKQNALQSTCRQTFHYSLCRDQMTRTIHKFNARLVSQFGERETNDLIYLVSLQNIDTSADFGTGDFFHLSGAGYNEAGDALAASILGGVA